MQMTTTTTSLYDLARNRVESTPELAAHAEMILADWAEGDEHWQWVLDASVAEIVEWATAGNAGDN